MSEYESPTNISLNAVLRSNADNPDMPLILDQYPCCDCPVHIIYIFFLIYVHTNTHLLSLSLSLSLTHTHTHIMYIHIYYISKFDMYRVNGTSISVESHSVSTHTPHNGCVEISFVKWWQQVNLG